MELPDDYSPKNREAAQMLANERGCAWYKCTETASRRIYFVTSETPLNEKGEYVLWGNMWTNAERDKIVAELNRAYLLGLRKK